jgi:mannose-6-phosphate isomerase-like protein (cupin superfamily)
LRILKPMARSMAESPRRFGKRPARAKLEFRLIAGGKRSVASCLSRSGFAQYKRGGHPMSEKYQGQIGHRIVFENDRVRIWEMTLEPGESSDDHEHKNDYVMCIVEGESIDADFESGQSIQLQVLPGKAIFVPAGNRTIKKY